jgi:hypothetical protein
MIDIDQVIKAISNIPDAMDERAHQSRELEFRKIPISIPIESTRLLGLGETDPFDLHQPPNDVPLEGLIHSVLDDQELGEAIEQAVESRSPWGSVEDLGTDALAWYVSFHRDKHNWGIYIPVTGLLRYAKKISPRPLGYPHSWESVVRLALRSLLAHERLHYAVDYASSQIEILFERACYLKTQASLRGNSGHIEDEEQLANGLALRAIRWAPSDLKIPGAYNNAVEFTKKQPAGYNRGIDCIYANKFLMYANQYISRFSAQSFASPVLIDYTKFMPLGPLVDYRGAQSRLPPVNGRQCPVYLVLDEASAGLPSNIIQFFDSIAPVTEGRKFLKNLRRFNLDKDWADTKHLLEYGPRGKLDFKHWRKEDAPGLKAWSVRVGKGNTNFRAHLYQYAHDGSWVADSVDTAERQGHH